MKKIISALMFFIILLFSSCNSSESDDLINWVGIYTFEELYPHYIGDYSDKFKVHYKIIIYEDNSDYFADIVIELPLPIIQNLQAKLIGDEEWISLILISPNNILRPNSAVNDILVSFRRENSDIYTYWGEIQPWDDDNIRSNKIYFEKVDDS